MHLYEDEVVKFMLTPEGLYVYKPSQEFLDSNASLKAETGKDDTKAAICYVVISVDDNKKRFTERQFIEANDARNLDGMIGRLTARNFRYLLKPNVMQDNTVKGEDIDIADKIFGTDVATLKGKSTGNRPPTVRSDEIQVPREILIEHCEL